MIHQCANLRLSFVTFFALKAILSDDNAVLLGGLLMLFRLGVQSPLLLMGLVVERAFSFLCLTEMAVLYTFYLPGCPFLVVIKFHEISF